MDESNQSGGEQDSAASALQRSTIGVRVHIERMRVRRSLTPEQRAITANAFGADSSALFGTKLLIDTRDPVYRAVSAVVSEITTYWRLATIAYPESGVRLLPRGQIGVFNNTMNDLAAKLRAGAAELQQHSASLRESARTRLGSLFDPADFPDDLEPEYHVDWEFVAVEVPSYLSDLNDLLYEKERQRVARRFQAAAKLIEESVIARLTELLAQILTWLTKQPPLDRKPLPRSVFARLTRFIQEFRDRRPYCSAPLALAVEEVGRMIGRATSAESAIADEWRMHAIDEVHFLLTRIEPNSTVS